MKIIVVYKSKYGTAEQYAKWIAEELNCDVKEMGEIRARDLDAYDGIIFGGGVHAGGIEGFDTFRKWLKPVLSDAYFASFDEGVNFRQDWYKPSKKIIIFAVGINVQNFDARAELRNVNFDKKWLRHVTCYFLDGKYEPEKVQGADKLVMKFTTKLLNDKGLNMNADERQLLDRINNGCDLVDRSQIEPILKEFRESE
jgi:menaquinone-dependent protoporphyrinogen IX oxidase